MKSKKVKEERIRFSELKHILKEHKLRVTDCRIDVLSIFMTKKHAVTLKDLEDDLTKYDRVTLFRTLNSFRDNALIHQIPNDRGSASYGLSLSSYKATTPHFNHLHFKCNDCGTLECLEETVELPTCHLPANYTLSEVDIIVNGTCEKCNS